MKSIVPIIFYFVFILNGFSQEENDIYQQNQFNEIVNLIPNCFENVDSNLMILNKEVELNSIGKLYSYFRAYKELNINEIDLKKIINRAQIISEAFCRENNPIFLKSISGDTIGPSVFKSVYNNKYVTTLNFYSGCEPFNIEVYKLFSEFNATTEAILSN